MMTPSFKGCRVKNLYFPNYSLAHHFASKYTTFGIINCYTLKPLRGEHNKHGQWENQILSSSLHKIQFWRYPKQNLTIYLLGKLGENVIGDLIKGEL